MQENNEMEGEYKGFKCHSSHKGVYATRSDAERAERYSVASLLEK